jgi:Kef-type K+ transport system membrane component KefB
LIVRASGMPWRESLAVGVLVNTKGLVELVILNVGLDLHIISPTLFSIW